MSLAPSVQIRKVEGAFLESDVDGELMLLNVATGSFNGLRAVGLAIWRALDETPDPARIKAMLGAQYDVDPVECDREVDVFLASLIEAGLLVRM